MTVSINNDRNLIEGLLEQSQRAQQQLPQMPADLNARLMQRMSAQQPRRQQPVAPVAPAAQPKAKKLRRNPVVVPDKFMAAQTAPDSAQPALVAAVAPQPAAKMKVITERDIPITRPENYQHTPEEFALLKKQAAEAYLKWVELELEISRNNLEQAMQK